MGDDYIFFSWLTVLIHMMNRMSYIYFSLDNLYFITVLGQFIYTFLDLSRINKNALLNIINLINIHALQRRQLQFFWLQYNFVFIIIFYCATHLSRSHIVRCLCRMHDAYYISFCCFIHTIYYKVALRDFMVK